MDGAYYHIDSVRLGGVAYVARLMDSRIDLAATTDICIDTGWAEGSIHQDWLDNASIEEIADWVATIYASAHNE